METSTAAFPLGHKTLRLRDLDPKHSPAFSPNLYRWLRAHAHFYRDGGIAESVWRVKPDTEVAKVFGADTLLIGYPLHGHPGDTDFAGVRLMATMCQGTKAGKWCYGGIAPDLIEVASVWDKYLKVGRCAIDPEHHEGFMGDRYTTDGDSRTCLWCGHKQRKIVTQRVVYDESWVPVK